MRDTIDMARESWIDVYGLGHDRAKFIKALKHFECLARADEREACAKVCEDTPWSNWFTADCVAAIRARGNA
jgi:hypothetical protein